MSYSIDIDPRAQDAIAALPADALLGLAEALAVLELAPWSAGRSVNPERNPDARSATSRSARLAMTDRMTATGGVATGRARAWMRLCHAVPALRRRTFAEVFAASACPRGWERAERPRAVSGSGGIE